jgi:hypothetical protein
MRLLMNQEYPSQLIEMGFIPFQGRSKPHSLQLKQEAIDESRVPTSINRNGIYTVSRQIQTT